MALERFAAAWRESYVTEATQRERQGDSSCVFCELASAAPSLDSGVIARSASCFVCLNAYPYGSGHLLVLPLAHVAGLDEVDDAVGAELFAVIRQSVAALQRAYGPDGFNVGFNLGRAGGAGIPAHLHAHALPRWSGDTNFMTALAETRVLPESLPASWAKVTESWDNSGPAKTA
jgi:ATP adenylyltransferase